jgi:capsular exopolysaccharide synthesis family protein
MLAGGAALLIEYLDDTVKTAEDVEQAISLPTFGIVGVAPASQNGSRASGKQHTSSSGAQSQDGKPSNGKAGAGVLVAADAKSPFGEAYRVLRTNLQFATLNRPCKALLVSSAGPREGKSFTLSNLAVVLTQAGMSVVVVDSDVRRPALHRMFGVSAEKGLTNLLIAENPGDLTPYLQPTEHAGLRVLASGRPLPPNPTELLSSPQMARVVAALKEEADIVLFDSPPALSVADAAILSAYVDGVLLVVDAGRNRSEVMARAKDAVSGHGTAVLGVVLNRFKARHDGYYYQYHYYNYGYSYAHPRDKVSKERVP